MVAVRLMLGSLDNKQKQWLAGFFEGDGKVGVAGNELTITFDEEGNQGIQRYIGNLLGCDMLGNDGIRLVGSDCTDFLTCISGFLVSSKRTEQLNRYRQLLGLPESVMHVPTLDWLVGNWDANGSSKSAKRGGVSISVSNSDTLLLYVIRQTFGGYQYGNGNYFPFWQLASAGSRSPRFSEVVNYLVENSKNEPRRLKLKERLERVGW